MAERQRKKSKQTNDNSPGVFLRILLLDKIVPPEWLIESGIVDYRPRTATYRCIIRTSLYCPLRPNAQKPRFCSLVVNI
jgi:hypothetical protein